MRAFLELVQTTSPHQQLTAHEARWQLGQRDGCVDQGWARRVVVRLRHAGHRPGPAAAWSHAIAPPVLAAGVAPQDVRLSGLFIATTTTQPEACWRYLAHLSTQPPVPLGSFPVRRSVVEASAFLSAAPEGTTEVFRAYARRRWRACRRTNYRRCKGLT